MKTTIPLTETEQVTVEKNIDLVEKVIKRHIQMSRNVNGLDYDDLFQIGCIGLCHAAKTYNGSVQFATYASKVIKNKLIDHCRKVAISEYPMVLMADMEDICISNSDILEDIEALAESYTHVAFSVAREKYMGSVRKGIISMELRMNGYPLKEIATYYDVSSQLVGVWISKAAQRLRKDESFITSYFPNHKVGKVKLK